MTSHHNSLTTTTNTKKLLTTHFLLQINAPVARNHISTVISALTHYLPLNKVKLSSIATKTIEMVITTTISNNLWIKANNEEDPDDLFNIDTLDIKDGEESGPSNFQKIVATLQYLTKSEFHLVQKNVSSILCTFFEKLDLASGSVAFNIIESWVENKNNLQDSFFEPVVGKFIQHVGVKDLLNYYPIRPLEFSLESETYEMDSNSWMLPILKKYLKQESVAHFLEYFFPLIRELDARVYDKHPSTWNKIDECIERIYE